MTCPECLRKLQSIEGEEGHLYKCTYCNVEYTHEELHQSEDDFDWGNEKTIEELW